MFKDIPEYCCIEGPLLERKEGGMPLNKILVIGADYIELDIANAGWIIPAAYIEHIAANPFSLISEPPLIEVLSRGVLPP